MIRARKKKLIMMKFIIYDKKYFIQTLVPDIDKPALYRIPLNLDFIIFFPKTPAHRHHRNNHRPRPRRRGRMLRRHSQFVCTSFTRWKELHSSSCSLSAAQFSSLPQCNAFHHTIRNPWQHMSLPVRAAVKKDFGGNVDQDIDTVASTSEISSGKSARGSGTTARGRRLLKVREEKRKRDYDRLHNYPAWAKVLEDACKNDSELRAVLGDSIGNPDEMRKKVEERVRKRGSDFTKSKSGSVLAFKVIQSWYVMGRLGAFNSSNLQLGNASMDYDPTYDADKGFNVMPSSFHDIGDVEFQDNWGRVWVDLGTADFFSIDVLLNCLTVMSSEYLGIQQVVFGGRKIGDWEEGMTSAEFGYKSFKI